MRGGRREGAGRKPGSATKRTREIANGAAERGELPLAYMLRVMRNSKADKARRDEMAKSAAPFIHPRLQSTTLATDPDKPLQFEDVTDAKRLAAVALMAARAARSEAK